LPRTDCAGSGNARLVRRSATEPTQAPCLL
jgi:hypothetical protein